MKQWYIYIRVCVCAYILYKSLYSLIFWLGSIFVFVSVQINLFDVDPFLTNVPILNHFKPPENTRKPKGISGVFKEYKMITLARNELRAIIFVS